METTHWLRAPAATPNEAAGCAAEHRQLRLTKPPGSLGQIERLAIRLAALQGTSEPTVDRVHIAVFAADHGMAAEQVSAFPQSVTGEVEVIWRSLTLHQAYIVDPIEALRRLGGFEIAALAGSYLACAQRGLPVLVEGFIASVAALAVERLCERAREWFLFAHTSAEPGHRRVLEALNGQPLLDLGMRLGEGSGAAVAVPLFRLACAPHSKMAISADAGVSGEVR
jgi:NaMN:DMB phosphoribosyltransferase